MSESDRRFSVPSIHFDTDHVDIDGKRIDLYTLGPDIRIDRSGTDKYRVTLTINADAVTISDDNPDDDINGDFAWMRGQIRGTWCTSCRNDLEP